MNKISEFLAGIKVLEEVESTINGRLTVVKSLAFGTYIQAGGLTQSGGIVKKIWDTTLRKVQSSKLKVKSCLILGLGGGSTVQIIQKYWPESKITAVDIDPLMVELGKKYLGLDEKKVKIVINDAERFLIKNSKQGEISKIKMSSVLKNGKKLYDLILVDLYNGDLYPEKFESENYIQLVRSDLQSRGIVVFNRLYYGDKRSQAMKFLKKLENNFPKVDVVYPEANVMFVCYK